MFQRGMFCDGKIVELVFDGVKTGLSKLLRKTCHVLSRLVEELPRKHGFSRKDLVLLLVHLSRTCTQVLHSTLVVVVFLGLESKEAHSYYIGVVVVVARLIHSSILDTLFLKDMLVRLCFVDSILGCKRIHYMWMCLCIGLHSQHQYYKKRLWVLLLVLAVQEGKERKY